MVAAGLSVKINPPFEPRANAETSRSLLRVPSYERAPRATHAPLAYDSHSLPHEDQFTGLRISEYLTDGLHALA